MLPKVSGRVFAASVNIMQKYIDFLKDLDLRLDNYFNRHKLYIHCRKGCSSCCETGDYPLSQLELEDLMQGYIKLDNEVKLKIQENIKKIKKGACCPFLIDKKCSVYSYRPIICRVHGLAYLCGMKMNKVKLPYCVNENRNYSNVYKDGEVTINPIKENLDTPIVLKDFYYGEIKNLYDWIKNET